MLTEKVSKPEFYKHLDSEVKQYEAGHEQHNMDERRSVTDHDHRFSLLGNRAECNCGWGIYLDNEDELRDGKLYRRGELII